MPIINPWTIYLIDLVDQVSVMLIFAGFLTLANGIFLFVVQEFEGKLKELSAKAFIVSGIVMLFIMILLPSSSTITKMVIAQNITVERVDRGVEVVEKVYNDILRVMEERQ